MKRIIVDFTLMKDEPATVIKENAKTVWVQIEGEKKIIKRHKLKHKVRLVK